MNLLIGLFTFVLVLISIFMVLMILAQRAKNDGGMGAALGGGVTEAAFGAESGNVLTKGTTYAAIGFFVIAFGLYLGHLYLRNQAAAELPETLPDSPALVAAPEEGVPANVLETPEVPAVTFATEAPADEASVAEQVEATAEAVGTAVEEATESAPSP